MIGAIAGDVIGSVFEHNPIKTADFPLFGDGATFTDDTVLTLAVMEAILKKKDYGETMREFYLRHPNRRYGSRFKQWANSWDDKPSDSFGNGSAMRVAPVGWAYNYLETVLEEAEKSARPTHNSREGIKGAQAVATSIFMARYGEVKVAIKEYIETAFGYDLSIPYEELKQQGESYNFEPTCEKTVPPALICFLDSTDYEDAVRKAVSLGWDSDTMGCITGGIAEAYYGGVSIDIEERVLSMLPSDLRAVADEITTQYYSNLRSWAGVCQLCGEFSFISNMATAWMTHAFGEYVCASCMRQLGDGDVNIGRRHVRDKLKDQNHRFCYVCKQLFEPQKDRPASNKKVCPHCLNSIPAPLSETEYLEKRHRLLRRQEYREWLRGLKTKPTKQ